MSRHKHKAENHKRAARRQSKKGNGPIRYYDYRTVWLFVAFSLIYLVIKYILFHKYGLSFTENWSGASDSGYLIDSSGEKIKYTGPLIILLGCIEMICTGILAADPPIPDKKDKENNDDMNTVFGLICICAAIGHPYITFYVPFIIYMVYTILMILIAIYIGLQYGYSQALDHSLFKAFIREGKEVKGNTNVGFVRVSFNFHNYTAFIFIAVWLLFLLAAIIYFL